MEIRESDLPGIGKKFSGETAAGEKIVIVIHHDGTRQLFRFGEDPDRPESITPLTDEEAHQFGAVLAGTYFQPVSEEAVLEVMKGLHLRWFPVTPGSFFAGHSIGSLGIRSRTGVSVIAIIRGMETHLPNPSPDEVLQVGDTVVALGTVEQMEPLLALTQPRESGGA